MSVPQGSFLEPLLFNINISGLPYIIQDKDVLHYVDDTTIYSTNASL